MRTVQVKENKMKKISTLFIFVLLISSCAPAAQTVAPTQTSAPTLTEASTSTPEPMMTLTQTPVASATLEPALFSFNIASDAPEKDVAQIKLGIDLARAYIRDFLGGDISVDFQKRLTIKIVMSGLGDQSNSGGGSCCTFHGTQIFYDLKHSNWNIQSSEYWDNVDHHMNSGAHEYAHAWQSSMGCLSSHISLGEDWLDEGLAEYISVNSLRLNGYVTRDDYTKIVYVSRLNTRAKNLSLFEKNPPEWPGEIGFVAVVKLVSLAPSGQLSLRTVCENVASGKSPDQSFLEAFGITKDDFYKAFAEFQRLGR
jgi:hypothetical protein